MGPYGTIQDHEPENECFQTVLGPMVWHSFSGFQKGLPFLPSLDGSKVLALQRRSPAILNNGQV